jgi:hypothetical protein
LKSLSMSLWFSKSQSVHSFSLSLCPF